MAEEGSLAVPTAAPPAARLPFVAKYGRFLLVGLTGVVVNLLVFASVLDLLSPSPTFNPWRSLVHLASATAPNPVEYLVGSAVAFVVATLWNFVWNNLWTFRTRVGHRHPLPRRLGLYYTVSLGSLAVNEVVLLGSSLFIPPLYGQGIGIVAGSLVGFFGNHRFTFAEAELSS